MRAGTTCCELAAWRAHVDRVTEVYRCNGALPYAVDSFAFSFALLCEVVTLSAADGTGGL